MNTPLTNIHVWVRERKPTTCLEVVRLADAYAQARMQGGWRVGMKVQRKETCASSPIQQMVELGSVLIVYSKGGRRKRPKQQERTLGAILVISTDIL